MIGYVARIAHVVSSHNEQVDRSAFKLIRMVLEKGKEKSEHFHTKGIKIPAKLYNNLIVK